jgi:NADH:ubiquinone oxidoreductase subunit F (NADH-binding)
MSEKTQTSKGSYIIVKPIESEKETYKGKVIIENIFKNIEVGEIIIYHLNDAKEIYINNEKFHAIEYYDVLIHETTKGKEISKTGLTFQGLDASF